ncbi:hypothetical protein EA797_15685 [Stutzerimonas zhaodongensis]|uniref:Knr4/Smi1-like domain-containing protein n=1 Tax=Stutzerimonas zhaodongensis TaxID=1176257 RepID=A0A3M2HU87_9GAMM|nr:SMI1/KNR4 family protein [Stutzerimonas zhaodongensis]MCQ4315809.1 SMI1/KNR4 family protein [Stutzerimonas zhaodongensis]RMH89364.1 hypothetical protein EA797_15685 [Stutzerimonas zhaodongensis]
MTLETLDNALDRYLAATAQLGSPVRELILPLVNQGALDALRALDNVTLSNELIAYFRRIDGYNYEALSEQDLFEPSFAWGMEALSVDGALREHDQLQFAITDEAPNYWADGFLPILSDRAGSVVAVNCISSSPTFGAVYEMTDGVGLNRIASSLTEFLDAGTAAIVQGFIRYDDGMLLPEHPRFLLEAGPLYGDSPYFARVGKMDTQIVDWH